MLCSLCPLGGASRCGAPDFQTAEETRGLCHPQKIRGNTHAHKFYDTLCFNWLQFDTKGNGKSSNALKSMKSHKWVKQIKGHRKCHLQRSLKINLRGCHLPKIQEKNPRLKNTVLRDYCPLIVPDWFRPFRYLVHDLNYSFLTQKKGNIKFS